jgi:hypothetical protein
MLEMTRGWSHSSLNNNGLWLWVPAFAGTTKMVAHLLQCPSLFLISTSADWADTSSAAAAPAVAVLVSAAAVAQPAAGAVLAVQPVEALAAAVRPVAAEVVVQPVAEAAAGARAESPAVAAGSAATAALLPEVAVLSAPPHSAAGLSGFDRPAACRALPVRCPVPPARSGNSGGLVRRAALAGCWDLHPAFPEAAACLWRRERAARYPSAPDGTAPHRVPRWWE